MQPARIDSASMAFPQPRCSLDAVEQVTYLKQGRGGCPVFRAWFRGGVKMTLVLVSRWLAPASRRPPPCPIPSPASQLFILFQHFVFFVYSSILITVLSVGSTTSGPRSRGVRTRRRRGATSSCGATHGRSWRAMPHEQERSHSTSRSTLSSSRLADRSASYLASSSALALRAATTLA